MTKKQAQRILDREKEIFLVWLRAWSRVPLDVNAVWNELLEKTVNCISYELSARDSRDGRARLYAVYSGFERAIFMLHSDLYEG